jgi:hypothetical protein
MLHAEQELLILRENLCSPPVFGGVRVAQSLWFFLCNVFYTIVGHYVLLLLTIVLSVLILLANCVVGPPSFGHCVVGPSSFGQLCCRSSFFWPLCCRSSFFWPLCCWSFFFWPLCCRSSFIWPLCCWSFFFWPLCCRSFFYLRFMTIPLVSSTISDGTFLIRTQLSEARKFTLVIRNNCECLLF